MILIIIIASGIYTVTERCRDGWYKGCSERSQRCGVFPGNYVAPASNLRTKHDKVTTASLTIYILFVISSCIINL